MTAWRVYGFAALLLGIVMCLATFVYRVPVLGFLRSQHATSIAFLASAALSVPFVATYTKLGLNPSDDGNVSRMADDRRAAFRRECPLWTTILYATLGFIGTIWFGFAALKLPLQPFFAFSGGITSLTGLWFLVAHPVARRLFDAERA